MSWLNRRIWRTSLLLVALSLLGVGLYVYVMGPGWRAELQSAQAATAARPPHRPRVALVMKTLTSPFFVAMEKGARRAETEFGVELLVRTAAQETSVEQQIAIVDQLTRSQVDALVIAPSDSYGLVPVLRKTQELGIVVINVDNPLDPNFSRKQGLVDVPVITVDNTKAAYAAAKELVQYVKEPTEAAIIEGFRNAANAEARRRGALQAFEENPNITVVASEPANWKIDEAFQVAQSLFSRHPGIRILFCANDMMALGALHHLETGHIASVKVAGYDGLDEAKQAIRAGTLSVSIDQQAEQQGFLGVAYAVRALNGERLPPETILETRPITIRTLDAH
ncbi:substrate-binding domain-containing protein [Azospirillum melinis]|uniref:Substrate-binding domain-containing protein n=1 Tax=Azospirillum melinis TaxID=328839 RepID=A0ABX2KEL1_9PROT|nr:substrate-binding domain-containing protein [Azospirillum melinis]MBP2310631.1 ribose transport system substrate-binding protein [Azospirillum melinis]NUA99091.1 substrate-binding domain-containing protein [Azospirillum melinis]